MMGFETFRSEIELVFFDCCFDSYSKLSFLTSIYTSVGSDTIVKTLGSAQCINRVEIPFFPLHQVQKSLVLLHRRYRKEHSVRVERETITTSA